MRLSGRTRVHGTLMLLALLLLPGCAAMNQTEKGAIIGATTGAILGAAVGQKTGNTAGGAVVGAMIGTAAGAVIGREIDEQAATLEEGLSDAKVEKDGEEIKITFDSGILFDFNSSRLRADAEKNLNLLSDNLQQYPGYHVLVQGHTDSQGKAEYNQRLSERRAEEAAGYLMQRGVSPSRIQTQGLGATQPVDSNETETGRQNNRRVEIKIFASDEYRRQLENKGSSH